MHLDVQVTGRPPPGPTSPWAASRTRMPSPTPAGILTLISRRARTRPSPMHWWHGSGMTTPTPRQVGHGRDVITCPSRERCTVWTSPRPPHVSHGTGAESPLVPLPWQRSHSTAVSTVTCLVTPVAHSSRSSRIRSSESEPGRTRPMGPREVAPPLKPPPKKASNTSPRPPKPPPKPPPAAAAFSIGSPPRSTIRRFSGSLSTS
ncbi:chaperone DnaJ 2 domain protein [Mycobacterium intracellulare]|nr:chaperone DnaJ 2 domain protein [Mycobacterium intracellulare]